MQIINASIFSKWQTDNKVTLKWKKYDKFTLLLCKLLTTA